MSNLEQLLRTLNEEEIAKLHSLKLSPSERRFLKRKLQYIRTGTPKPQELASTEPYLYKLRSVLLTKIIAHIAGTNDIEILTFFRDKNLRAFTIRYLAIADKNGQLLSGTEKEIFYRQLFSFCLPWHRNQYDAELITKYAKKYAAARLTPLPDEHLFLSAHLLYYQSLSERLSDVREERTKAFFTLEKQVRNSKNVEAEFVALRGLIMLLRTGKDQNIPQAIRFVDRLLEIIESNPFYFSSRSLWGNQLGRAELTMLQGKHEEAYQSYKQLLRADPRTNNSGGYHEIRFFFCCLYTARFDEAQMLLDSSNPDSFWFLQISPSDRQICLITFHLLQLHIDESLKLITHALQRVDFDLLPDDEFYIRVLEVCGVILQKDYTYAVALIKRHLKFGEYHSRQFRFSVIPSALRLLHSVIEEQRTRKPIRKSQLQKLESLRAGEESYMVYSFYLLIQKIREYN